MIKNLIIPTTLAVASSLSMVSSAQAASGVKLDICDGQFARLPDGNTAPSAGCVVNTTQTTSDQNYIDFYGKSNFNRRYIAYVPTNLPKDKVPVVFGFHGYNTNAEAFAHFDTHRGFERLADEHGFIVIYPNGLHAVEGMFGVNNDPSFGEQGYFQSCFQQHEGEAIDVLFVRQILDEIEAEVSIDRDRIYATGLSAGGGMSLLLALEAPDLVKAIAPVAPMPFQPNGDYWQAACQLTEQTGQVSIAMFASTADPIIPYEGNEPFPNGFFYPAMESARDTWLSKMAITGEPTFKTLSDITSGDSYKPVSGLDSSYVELYQYPKGPQGQEFWYYKGIGSGHNWPHPQQIWEGGWSILGKANQDMDFAEQAWAFFQRH